MEPIAAIKSLVSLGWNQKQIAAAVETTQPTISRILAGNSTSFDLGSKLVQLAISAQQKAA